MSSISKSKEEINQRLVELRKDAKIVGDYRKQKLKTLFECSKGHTWVTTADNVIRRSGCPVCANDDRTKNQTDSKENFSKYLFENNRKLILVGEYTRSWNNSLFQCEVCEYQWMAKPNNIKNGRGCPKCAKYGFDPSKSAWSYIFERDKYIKYGITNNLEQRLDQHRRHGKILLHRSEYHEDGINAKEWENSIRKLYGGNFVSKEQCPDGWTETLSIDHLEAITRRR